MLHMLKFMKSFTQFCTTPFGVSQMFLALISAPCSYFHNEWCNDGESMAALHVKLSLATIH